MKKKYHLFLGCMLVFSKLLLISTACNPSTVSDTLTGGTSDSKEYVITQNGDINYPKDSTLAVQYYTFLIDNYYNSRALYFGGLVPSGYNPDELVVSFDCTGLQYSSYNDNYIKSYRLNSKDYYYVPIIVNSNKNPGDYIITARLHKQGFNAIIAKTYTLKVAQYLSQGNWGLNVYQQASYNKLNDTKDVIISEFKKMGVEFGSSGVNIVNVKSDLPDAVINYNYISVPVEDDPCVIYAFSKIYPNITDITEAINTYSDQHPNEGLLFFVKDYNMLNPPPTPPIVLGYTISGVFANGIKKRAPISFIFVERHLDVNTEWQGEHIQTTVLHELGHLWCENFTDNETHSLWHNSDNKDRCLMKSGLTFINQVPDEAAQKVLNFRGFCTGHLQRGLNISWHLKQYIPFGEGTGGTYSPDNNLIASNTNIAYSSNNDLDIELSCDKSEIIQGESIDILAKIKNNTTDTISISLKYYLYDLDTDSTFKNQSHGGIIIPPSDKYYFMLDPSDYLVFSGIDFSANKLKPGNYEFYTSGFLGRKEYLSSKINIKVEPVPDSLVKAFNDLKYDPNKKCTTENSMELAEMYKGTFYEQQFYFKLLVNRDFYNAIQNEMDTKEYRTKALALNKEFILKYPNTNAAYRLLNRIMYNYDYNQVLVAEILTSLKNNQPECKLLEVLRNQPEYLYKKIIHLLY